MRKSLFAAFFSIALLSLLSGRSGAQVVIQYWNFNNVVVASPGDTLYYPNIPVLKANNSLIDTNKAVIAYVPQAGSSTKSDDSAWFDGNSGTTTGAQFGAAAGNSLRLRNPSDAMELRFYIPTTNFKNISVQFALKTSSTGSGQATEVYDYSVDSGLTWKTSSLTVNGANVDTINVGQNLYTNFVAVTIGFGSDTTVNNNPKLILRAKFTKQNTGTSGNNLFDNFSVIGSYLASNIAVLAPPAGDTLFVGQPDTIIYQTSGLLFPARAVYLSTDSGDSWTELGLSTKDTFVWVVPNHASNNCFLEVIDTVNGIIGKSSRFIVHVPRISVLAPPAGDTLLVGQRELISYSLAGAISGFRSINYSYDSGKSWSFVDESVQDTFTWIVPNTPSNNCFIQVKDQNGIVGLSGRFLILTMKPPPPPPDTSHTAPPGLIHYWNFDNFILGGLAPTYGDTAPNVPRIKAFYSKLDTNAATIIDTLQPGTSKYYVGWVDNVAGDTTNHQLGDTSKNALRARNPSDSMEILMRIPSTGYKNLSLQYAMESSSTKSGQLVELFDYSVDGGTTWKSSALTVQGANVDTLDVTNPIFQGTSWGLVTVTFGNDSAVNNNPNLILRIKFRGNTTGTGGNNRFEHVTLEGVSTAAPPPPPIPDSISVSMPDAGDTLLAGTHRTISYTITATTGKSRSIDYSTNGGATWISIATGDTALTYNWIVPATPTSNALVRVRDSIGVMGVSSPFVILVPGTVDSVWLSPSPVIAGASTNINWKASGYLGNTVTLDVFYDGVTPNLLESGSSEANGSYAWTVPDADVNGVFVQVSFASGSTGQSAPFNIVAPASVSDGLNALANIELWPNPFQTQTTIQYELTSSENVSFSIHDLMGREIETVQEGIQSAGVHEITFDGSREPDGVYVYELTASDARYRGELVIVR